MPESKTPWLCDVLGCDQEFDIQIGDEKRCLHHAQEKADEERRRLYARRKA